MRAPRSRLMAGRAWAAALAALLLGTPACERGSTQPLEAEKERTAAPGGYAHPKYGLWHIGQGNVTRAIEICQPTGLDDSENHFCLAVAHGQLGDSDEAMRHVELATAAGVPAERFFAGPRELLAPLTRSQAFRTWAEGRSVELLHGPMVGAVTSTSARFWVRTLHEVDVQIRATPRPGDVGAIASETRTTSAERDFTTTIDLSGLSADTAYEYDVFLDGQPVERPLRPRFRTYPLADTPGRFEVAFGGCANYIPRNERMWDTIRRRAPLAFVFLGDNTYFNIPDDLAHQRHFFYRRHARPEFRGMVASTSIYAIYDDHDFSGNDGFGGPEIETPAWKRNVTWRAFRENFVNPYYGGGDAVPGVWTDFEVGDVHFILLDGRYYRTDPEGERPTMLGPVQKQWLFETLAASTASFKILASPVPFAPGAKRIDGGRDTWDGYPAEREEIFSFIERNRIEGVFLISGDRHRSDAWRIERGRGYDFYEASTAHLTKNGTHPLKPEALFSHRGRPMYGLLGFDFTTADPELRYSVIDIDAERVDSLTLRRSQLSFSPDPPESTVPEEPQG